MDAFKNFSRSTLASGIASAATSLTVTTGHGAKFPATPFNATIWNSTDYTSPESDPNVEIVRVTAIATDTFTVARGQEGTADVAHNSGGKLYGIVAALTALTLNKNVHPTGFRAITATATILPGETLVVFDTSAGGFTATLPLANAVAPGYRVFFFGYGASGTAVLTVSRQGGSDMIRTGGISGSSSEATTDVHPTANRQQGYMSDGVSKWYKS